MVRLKGQKLRTLNLKFQLRLLIDCFKCHLFCVSQRLSLGEKNHN